MGFGKEEEFEKLEKRLEEFYENEMS